MAQIQTAPILKHNIDKKQFLIAPYNMNFYQIPQAIADKLNQKLGNSSAQLRLMYVLIGTKEGFGLSLEWLSQRTSLAKTNIVRTKKAIIDAGLLLESTDGAHNFLTINYQKIME